ncbi:DNA cytosine methyltransferase [Sedimentibacter sp. B4]|uniref:DNA cytosine methyltransferase n=1 Tax=Sedimentibacter sp. B4 TaxID=304766 RepID=UPI0002FC670E|nr:DNA cytosine methyltransferase [Sedimentibacter sp. B4]
MINYIDLFAGAGGLSEGFTASGYRPVAHVEMNADACMTLKTRACYYYLKDADKEDLYNKYLKGLISRDELYTSVPKKILDTVINETMSAEGMPALFNKISVLMSQQEVDSIDLIVGGPPCQAYSLVGRAVKGENMKNDQRNYLYKLYIQVLNKYKPKMFVFENVPGLLTANKGQYFEDMRMSFSDAGYNLNFQILNAKNFDVLQSRQRVILIGWLKGSDMHYPEFEEKSSSHVVKDILDDLPCIQSGEENNNYGIEDYNEYLTETGIRKEDDILTWHVSRPNIERDRSIYKTVINTWDTEKRRIKYTELPNELCTHKNRTAFLDRFKVVASDLPTCHTMMAHISKDGHYFIHPDINQARSITVREAARIQSFPDNFYFEGSRTAAFTQIGNAVPPLMAKGIALELKKQLENKNE